jgi:hypothetical protein
MDMANRVTQLSAAMLGAVFAGLVLSATPAAAATAKDCLTTPGQASAGQHWYYRIEHPSNRRCWYARDEGPASAKAAPQVASNETQAPTVPPSETLQNSVANARAEMMPANPAPPVDTGATSTAVANANPNGSIAPRAASPGTAPGASLAERWSDHPAANDPVQAASPKVGARVSTPSQSTPLQPAADDAALSWWVTASEGVGALALLGIATLVIRHYRRGIEIETEDAHEPDEATWEAPLESEPSAPAMDDAPMSWIRIAREARIDQQRDEVEQLLAQSRERAAV